jgi:hypothetical protein
MLLLHHSIIFAAMIAIAAQVLGYIASILLAVSLLVNNDLKFRWLNTFGCLAFICYGILIGAFPVILTNSILLLINAVYLFRVHNTKEDFDLLEFRGDEKMAHKFLSFYKKDIDKYFPGFDLDNSTSSLRFVVIRDIVIANLFAATVSPDGIAVVDINYTVEKYRDYKVGKFIFEQERKYLLSKGVKKIVYTSVHNSQHEKFLIKMGFTKGNGNEAYSKSLL